MTRRVPPAPEFAVPLRVQQMWEAFEYPDDLGGGGPADVAGGGGAPTVVVAGEGASSMSIERSDYQLVTFQDHSVVMQGILDVVGLLNGRVLFTEGNLNLEGDITIPAGVSLEGLVGVGAASTITGTGVITLNSGAVIRNFYHLDDGRIVCSGSDHIVSDFTFDGTENVASCIETGTGTRVENITAFGTTTTVAFIDVTDSECIIRRVRSLGHAADSPLIRVGGSLCVVDGVHATSGRILEVDTATAVDISNLTALALDSDNAPPVWVHDSTGVTFSNVAIDGLGCGASPRAGILIEDSAAVHIGNDFVVKDYFALGASESTVFQLDTVVDSTIAPTVYNGGAANVYDLMQVVTSDRNKLIGGMYVPDAGDPPRYGISLVSGNNNAAFANYLGDASVYTTADYNDAATGTITTPDANGQFTY